MVGQLPLCPHSLPAQLCHSCEENGLRVHNFEISSQLLLQGVIVDLRMNVPPAQLSKLHQQVVIVPYRVLAAPSDDQLWKQASILRVALTNMLFVLFDVLGELRQVREHLLGGHNDQALVAAQLSESPSSLHEVVLG